MQIDRLARDQRQTDARPSRDCHILVENERKMLYIRRGLNQNNGDPQHDCFILRRDGSIEGDIDWDYQTVTRIDARPIDEKPLVVSGGVFTTLANRMEQPVGYNYWARGIDIIRSNTVVDGLTHYVVGETAVGHPYRGFLNAYQCANITFRNCFATPHKIYSTIGAAGKPVNMGSYDLHANNVVNLHLANCRMNLICDRTRWGRDRHQFLQEHPPGRLHLLAHGHAYGCLRPIHHPALHLRPYGPERHRSRCADH